MTASRINKTTTLILALLVFSVSVMGQSSWHTSSSPDKSFSVELPVPLRKVMSFSGEHGASLERDQKLEWASSYAAIETTPKDSRFGIIVVETKQLRKIDRIMSRKELFEALSNSFLADDDELQFMKEPFEVKHNGLKGKEYLYVKENTINSTDPTLFTRGRIFDTNDKIYVLIFVGKDNKDLSSSDAERFLNSFRLNRRTKN
jgi:hypothetical protein